MMENALAGRIRFHGTAAGSTINVGGGGGVSATAKSITSERPFIKVPPNVDVALLAGFVVNTWQVPSPDIIVTVCSGVRTSSALSKEAQRYALQRGFTKLFSTANAWIFTHGCHVGISTLVGEAVKQEQERRSHIVLRGKGNAAQRKFYNKKLPKIVLFGVPSQAALYDPSVFDRPQQQAVTGTESNAQPPEIIVDYVLGGVGTATGESSNRPRFDLDPFHTHFIVIDDRHGKSAAALANNESTVRVRGELEQELHLYAQEHRAAAAAAARAATTANGDADNAANFVMSDSENDDDNEHQKDVYDTLPSIDDVDSEKLPSPAVAAEDSGAQPAPPPPRDTRIPIISLVIQGGPEQLEQILFFLKSKIPCVVIKGSGLLADILAVVYEDLFIEGATSFEDADLQALRSDTTSRLKKQFGGGGKRDERSMDACFDRIAHIMRMANQNGRKFLSVVNLKNASDFVDLDKFILKALFASQDIGESLLRQNPDLLRNDLLLTLKWNNANVARSEIFQSEVIGQWSKLRTDREVFDQALMLKKREDFVDMFLMQGFKVHKYLSHKKLLQLFRRAEDTEFFHSVVLQGIMGRTTGSQIHETFIVAELNPLIYQLTHLKEFIDVYAITANAYGINKIDQDIATARRRALLALLVWAIMLNRNDLAVILWKHCDHPIPTALFAARLFTKMSELCSEPEMTEQLYKNGTQFGQRAIDILELGYNDGGGLAFEVLETRFAEFANKTVVVLAYESKNRFFLSHPCCQKWLNRLYQGRIDVTRHNLGPLGKLIPDAIKIVLSAWFILPMFVWIRFPADYYGGAGGALGNKHRKTNSGLGGEEADEESSDDDQLALYGDPSKARERERVTRALRSTAASAWRSVQKPTEQIAQRTTDLIGRGAAVTWRGVNPSGIISRVKPITGRVPTHTTSYDIELGALDDDGGEAGVIRNKTVSLTPVISSGGGDGSSSGSYENVSNRNAFDSNGNVGNLVRVRRLDSNTVNETTAAPDGGTSNGQLQPRSVNQNRRNLKKISGGSAAPLVTEYERRERELKHLAAEQRRVRAQGLTKIRILDEPLRTINKQVLRRGRSVSSSLHRDIEEDLEEEEARIPLHRKIYYLWQAPVTKYWTNLFAYIAFLTLYSIAAFVPDCDVFHVDLHLPLPYVSRAFSLAIDAVVWLWTALYTLELALRTYRQWYVGVPFQVRKRCMEIALLTVALVIYISIRSLTLVFQWFSPFTSRVIMLLGLLYFYFRLILLFFPLSRELGPLLVRVRVMCTSALTSFLKFLAPFMCAYMIIIQVVLYPDKQLNMETLWQALKRALFSFFTTNLGEMEETSTCAAKRLGANEQRNRTALFDGTENLFFTDSDNMTVTLANTTRPARESCITGSYTDVTCANGGFWTYFFMIQWLFIFKLVLMSMLYAFFTTYTLRITQESEQIWKYQRYQLVVDIATRSALPPPISIISHLIWLGYSMGLGAFSAASGCYAMCCGVCCGRKRDVKAPVGWGKTKKGSTSYWQAMAQQYWRDREFEAQEKSKPEKQFSTILALKEDLDVARGSIRRMRNKLMSQEKVLSTITQQVGSLIRPSSASHNTGS